MTGRELFRDGDWLGDYEIRGRLRAGGMATLLLAQRHGAAGVSRPVVIKVIHPHLAGDELMVRMFIDEARISSHIRHSNVVYIEKFGEHDGVYYIVMEYVDGCSLQDLLVARAAERTQLPIAIAVHLAIEVAAGLHAAHETTGDDGEPLGVVHRDVSPSNVLLTRDGRVKVIDFGVAKARGRLGASRSGSGLKGKLRYMSPDQAWGRPLDRRADVYALGICLWEMLTCRALFRANHDLAVLELVRNPVIPPPSQHNPAVSPALDAIVLRATALRPEDRHQTALELRRDLMNVVPGAIAIPPEAVGELVHHVCSLDRAAIMELGAMTEDLTDPSAPPVETSVSGAVGELRPRGWRSRGLVVAGLAAACAIAAVIAMTGGPDDAVQSSAPPAAAPRLDAGSAVAPARAAASDRDGAAAAGAMPAAGAPPTTGSTAGSTPTAGSTATPTVIATPQRPQPEPRPHPATADRPGRPAQADGQAGRPRVTTVEADGAVLADEPAPRPGKPAQKPAQKPTPKPPGAVRADDAVLSQ
jgi:serine/threonine-protein kinase